MLPMRSQMTFRASRGSSASCGTSPSVIAATVGAKMDPVSPSPHRLRKPPAKWRLLDGEGTGRKKDGRANQDRTFKPGSVNHRPGRNMKANADQARDGEHDAHLGCGPASGCDQKHADKRTQPALHIGEEKVYGVQPMIEAL